MMTLNPCFALTGALRVGRRGPESDLWLRDAERAMQEIRPPHRIGGIGVDLEREHSILPHHARFFLTARERSYATGDLTELWVLKEAAWKALGCGSGVPFKSLELQFDEEGIVRAIMLHGRSRHVWARIGRPWPGYLLAVVWAGEVEG